MRPPLTLGLAAAIAALACGKKPQAAPDAAASASSPLVLTPPPALHHGSATVPLRTALIWEEQAGVSHVPQLFLYDDAVSCEARLSTSAKHFYASMLGESAHLEPGEYRSPNWGFSGAPDVVPGPEGDEGYPPAYWGTVHVAKVTDNTVSGTLRFSSKGLTIEGPFEATRCPP